MAARFNDGATGFGLLSSAGDEDLVGVSRVGSDRHCSSSADVAWGCLDLDEPRIAYIFYSVKFKPHHS
jgi:hypothetical protein